MVKDFSSSRAGGRIALFEGLTSYPGCRKYKLQFDWPPGSGPCDTTVVAECASQSRNTHEFVKKLVQLGTLNLYGTLEPKHPSLRQFLQMIAYAS